MNWPKPSMRATSLVHRSGKNISAAESDLLYALEFLSTLVTDDRDSSNT